MSVKKQHAGNPPANGTVAAECDLAGVHWSLYVREPSTAQYVALKLVADRAQRKANYWLGYDRSRERVTRSRDSQTLENRMPVLWRWLLEVTGDWRVLDEDRIYEPIDFGAMLGTAAPSPELAKLLGT